MKLNLKEIEDLQLDQEDDSSDLIIEIMDYWEQQENLDYLSDVLVKTRKKNKKLEDSLIKLAMNDQEHEQGQ